MTQINFRLEDDVKAEADYILDKIGISMTSALNIFVRQLIARRGIPFEVRLPSNPLASPDRIRKALQDYDDGRKNYHFHELPEDEDASHAVGEPRMKRSVRHAKAMV